jgi:hypothetical protein
MDIPQIWNYGEGRSKQHNTSGVTIDGRDYWFSYETIVAFRDKTGEKFVRENEWGPTTGKHLNWIDGGDEKTRLSADKFAERLSWL